MKSLRFFDRRAGYSLASLGLLLGVVAPSAIPAFASASDLITSRSITMSSSATGASDTIEVKGTTTGAINASGGLVIIFCSDSPLIGATCTAPTGMTITSPTAGGTDAGTASSAANNEIKWVSTSGVGAGGSFDFTVSGITNPSGAGSFYARMASYSSSNIGAASDDKGTGVIDAGAVALSATDNIGVTAYVLESMTFCVSGDSTGVLTGDCGTDDPDGGGSGVPSGTSLPSMTLGETSGSVTALDTAHVSHKDVNTQLSTNASSGVTVNLKSDAAGCGGLYRNGVTSNCNIAPQDNGTSTTISAGDSKFGLKVGSASSAAGAANASGTGLISTDGSYGSTNYYIEYVSGDATGVTSTYGSTLFHSTGPVNNQDVPITFGASVSNTTPAGVYGANMSLIATGKF